MAIAEDLRPWALRRKEEEEEPDVLELQREAFLGTEPEALAPPLARPAAPVSAPQDELQRFRDMPVEQLQRAAYQTEPVQVIQRAAYERPEEMRQAFAELPPVSHPLVPQRPEFRAGYGPSFEELPTEAREAISTEAFLNAFRLQTQPLREEWQRKFGGEDVLGHLLTAAALVPFSPILGAYVAEETLGLRSLAPGPIKAAVAPVGEALGAGFEAVTEPMSQNLQELGVPEQAADIIAEVVILASVGKAPATQVRFKELIARAEKLSSVDVRQAVTAIREGEAGFVRVPGSREAAKTTAAEAAVTEARVVPEVADFVAPSVNWAKVPPTSGIWANMTNRLRAIRGLPELAPADFQFQAQAKGTIFTYGRWLEETARFREAAIVKYQEIVGKVSKLKPRRGNDAPEWLRGTELDILERPQAYVGGGKIAAQRARWQRYGEMDIADLQARGIDIKLHEDYVFQHRYSDAFREMGIPSPAAIPRGVRGRPTMTRPRRFTTVYDVAAASRNGVAVARDGKGVLHTVLLGKGKTVREGEKIQVGVQKVFGKERPIMAEVERIAPTLRPNTIEPIEAVGGRFEQSGLLRAQKSVFDSMSHLAVNTARRGVPEGYVKLEGLQGKLADLSIMIETAGGKMQLVPVRRLAWPKEYARIIQDLVAPKGLPGPLATLQDATLVARDVLLNLDPSMLTLIYSRFPLGHPVTFLRTSVKQAQSVFTESGWREWVAKSPSVKWFIENGGGGLFRRPEYLISERGPVLERMLPPLRGFNKVTMTQMGGYATVETARTNYSILSAVRRGLKVFGADKLGIPLTRIGRMTDAQLAEAAVKSAMDQYGRIKFGDLGLTQLSQFAWRQGILTPAFLKTHISLLLNTPKAFLGNPEGVLGLLFLSQYVATMGVLAEGLSRLSGYHTSLDPRNVNFLAIRAPFGTFTAAGQIRTYMRLFANTPGDLRQGYYDRFARAGMGRLGIWLRDVSVQLKGEEYFGAPLETPADRARALLIGHLPIGFGGVAEAFSTPALAPYTSSLAEWTGAAFWPARTRDLIVREADKMGMPPVDEWLPIDWDYFFSQHPDLKERGQQEIDLAARQNQPWARLLQEETTLKEWRNGRLTNDEDTGIFQTLSKRELRHAFNEVQSMYIERLNGIRGSRAFADIVEEREKRRADKEQTPDQMLMDDYYAVFDLYKDDPTKDELFEHLDLFWDSLDPAELSLLEANLGLSLPPEARELMEDRRTVRAAGWFDVRDDLWGQEMGDRIPLDNVLENKKRQLEKDYPDQDITDDEAVTQLRFDDKDIDTFYKTLETTKYNWRWDNPDIEALLYKWGYIERMLNPEAAELYHGWTGKWPDDYKQPPAKYKGRAYRRPE